MDNGFIRCEGCGEVIVNDRLILDSHDLRKHAIPKIESLTRALEALKVDGEHLTADAKQELKRAISPCPKSPIAPLHDFRKSSECTGCGQKFRWSAALHSYETWRMVLAELDDERLERTVLQNLLTANDEALCATLPEIVRGGAAWIPGGPVFEAAVLRIKAIKSEYDAMATENERLRKACDAAIGKAEPTCVVEAIGWWRSAQTDADAMAARVAELESDLAIERQRVSDHVKHAERLAARITELEANHG